MVVVVVAEVCGYRSPVHPCGRWSLLLAYSPPSPRFLSAFPLVSHSRQLIYNLLLASSLRVTPNLPNVGAMAMLSLFSSTLPRYLLVSSRVVPGLRRRPSLSSAPILSPGANVSIALDPLRAPSSRRRPRERGG